MPISWLPKRRTIESDIQEEEARLEAVRAEAMERPAWQPPVTPDIDTLTPAIEQPQPVVDEFQPTTISGGFVPQIPQAPPAPTTIPTTLTPEASVPLWQKPKVFAEQAMESVGEAITKVPILPDILKWAAPGFEWIHENLERPFAATLTSLASPTLPWKSGESWLEHEKREYDAWQAPTYWKGIAEFAMPLWWLPWFGWIGKGGKALIGGGKAAKMAGLIDKSIPAKNLLPTYQQLEQFIPDNLIKRLALKAENIPVLGRMVKAVGGEAAFTRRNPLTAADKARNYAVFQGIQRDMGENLVRIQMNDLPMKRIISQGGKQAFKTEDDLLKLYDVEVIAGQKLNAKVGAVATDAAHPGVKVGGKVSLFIDDVWQNPNLYKWTDKAAFEYVKQGHETVGWFMQWAKANGVAMPSAKRGIQVVGEMIQEHIPRIAKGATSAEGLFAPFKRTNPFMEMVHDLMVEGVNAGVKYGGTFAERVELMSRAITRKVATKKFDNAVRPIGKTLLQRLEELEPAIIKQFGLQSNKVDILVRALRSLEKGKPVHYQTLGTIKEGFPNLGVWMEQATAVNTDSVINYIQRLSKSSQIVIDKNKKPLVEALKGLPERASLDDALTVVTRFAKSEKHAVRGLAAFYKQEVRAQGKEFKELIKHTQEILVKERANLAPLSGNVAKLKRNLRIPKEERFEAKFRSHPAFNQRIFPAEVVKVLEPLMTDRGHAWVRNMAQVSGTSRMLVAALDLSAPFIQGIMVFGRNPVAWAKSSLTMLRIAMNPVRLYTELAARKASRLERVMFGGSTASIDFFEALPIMRRVTGKIAGRRGERAVVETYGRAEAAFLGFGEIARDELWGAGKFMIGKKGLSEVAQESQMRELARSLDRMTGVMSPQALGLGLSQQQMESAWVFFAPRYTRAGLSFMGDILRGGFTGAEARKALGGLLVGASTMYMGVTSAMGQQPNLDPRSARFMTIKVGDTHLGVGGIYYAVLRMMANVASTAVEEPGQLSPLNFSRVDNPFYKFLYARTAPLTGLTFGLAIEQKNYFGEPFENVGDYAAFMADKVLPIAVQSVMPWEKKPWRDSAFDPAKLGAEFGGLRAFPESAWEARDIYRDNLSVSDKNRLWKDLTRAEQREIEQDNPVLEMFDKEIKGFNLRRGDPEDITFNRWMDEIDSNKLDRDMRIRNVAIEAQKTNDLYGFRKAIEDIENDYAAVSQHISSNKEYKAVMEELNKPKADEQLSRLTTLDAAYNVWASYRYSKDVTPWGRMMDAFGEPNWSSIEKLREWFRTNFGDEALTYVEQDRPLAGRDLPDLYMELREARRILRPYWQVKEQAKRTFGKPNTEWQQRRIDRLISRIRKQMRRTNPEMERAFQRFYARS